MYFYTYFCVYLYTYSPLYMYSYIFVYLYICVYLYTPYPLYVVLSFCVCTVTFVLLCFVCSFVLFLVVWFCHLCSFFGLGCCFSCSVCTVALPLLSPALCSIFLPVPWLAKGGVPVTPEKQTLKNNPYPSFFLFFSIPHPGTHPFSCLHENHPQTPE